MNNKISNIGRFLLAFIIFTLANLLFGCGMVERVTEYYPVYKEVKVPVACDILPPSKPIYEGDTVADNLNILKYAEELELAINTCIGVSNNEVQK